MVLNLVSIALVLLIAYMWSIRGFFSAFLHMVAVIVAGAFAFGLWEPASLWLLSVAPDKGILMSIGGNAWAIGLVVPFIVSLVVIRVVMDKLILGNVAQTTMANYIGGGACGLVTGILTVGILVIALGGLRYTDSTMGMGYRPVYYTDDRAAGGGSLVYEDSLWLPADKITGKFYSHLSRGAFFAPEPLSKWHPEPHIEGPASRLTYADGNAKNTARPSEVILKGLYTVGTKPDTAATELLRYEGGEQKYTDLHGERVSTGQVYGVKFELAASAKETTSQHMISPGQLRLLVQPINDPSAPSRNIFPIALISQGDGADANSYGRWRFEAEGVHVSSVGAGASQSMAAEFLVPSGYKPIAMYVKGVRLRLDAESLNSATKFATPGMRDAQVNAGTILQSRKASDLDRSNAFTFPAASIGRAGSDEMVAINSRIGSFGREAFQQSQKRNLSIDDKKDIVSGTGTWTPEEVSKGRDIPQNMRVDTFAVPDGTVMVQVNVSTTTQAALTGPVGSVADPNDPYFLIDAQGTPYQAVGFIYRDRERFDIRYTPGQPLRGLEDIDTPGLTTVRDDQRLVLLFLISKDVDLTTFAIGDKVVFDLDEPKKMTSR